MGGSTGVGVAALVQSPLFFDTPQSCGGAEQEREYYFVIVPGQTFENY